MIDNEMLKDATKIIKSIFERLVELKDKVVLAHACTSEIWLYYGLLVFVVFIKVAS